MSYNGERMASGGRPMAPRPRQFIPPQRTEQPAMDLLALLLPMFLWAELKLIGRVFIPEFMLIGALPILLMTRAKMLLAPLPRIVLLLGFAWLCSQVLTDLIRNTPFSDLSRGWAKILFTLLNFAALYMLLYGNRRRLILFGFGIAMGSLMAFIVRPNELAAADPWKFGVGLPVTLLVVLISQWKPLTKTRFVPAAMVVGIGMVSIVMGSRSLAGVTIIAGLYMLVQTILSRRGRTVSFSPVRTAMFFGAGILICGGLMTVYQNAASQGLLGDTAREKYQRQASGALGVLLGGRSATVRCMATARGRRTRNTPPDCSNSTSTAMTSTSRQQKRN